MTQERPLPRAPPLEFWAQELPLLQGPITDIPPITVIPRQRITVTRPMEATTAGKLDGPPKIKVLRREFYHVAGSRA